ncbi:hypothetical protein Hanom_Chr16g01433241 [Helianthus anomalus]
MGDALNNALTFFKRQGTTCQQLDTGRCGQGRLLDCRQPLGSPRFVGTRPPPARTHDNGIIGKPCLPSKTNRHHPYSPFTWMPQKIMGRVRVEPGSQGTPSFPQPLHHYLIGK